MIKTIVTFVFTFLLFVSNINAQKQTFEQKMKVLSTQIENVVETEKAQLKQEIKIIEKSYNQDKITFEEAKAQKEKATQLHANNIKQETEKIEEKVHALVQGKVDTKIDSVDKNNDGKRIAMAIDLGFASDSTYLYKRTVPYLVLGLGLNNMLDKGKFNSNFKWNSGSIELGLNFKTRILKNNPLYYLDYGLSYIENSYKLKNNQYFDTSEENTLLVTHPEDLKRSTFTSSQLILPLMIEFDFSKPKIVDGKKIFRRNSSLRFGFGGFGGFNVGNRQFIKYKSNGKKVKNTTKGNFNTNKFVYGLQGFVGYRDTSFYVKYDLQDTFTHSFTGQKNISFGVRFDW